MWLLIFVLYLISNMCLVISEDNVLTVELGSSHYNGNCKVLESNPFKIRSNATVKVFNNNTEVTVTSIEIKRQYSHNNPIIANHSVSLPIQCLNEDWTITVTYNGKIYSCKTKVLGDTTEIIPESIFVLLFLIVTPILIIIIIAQTCVLVYFIRKVKKLQQPETEKCIDHRPETPQNEARYITDPVIRNKKNVPAIEIDRESIIYEAPDLKIGDQSTLKSQLSIGERPRMPLPDEEVYYEPGQVSLPTPAFDSLSRGKPTKKLEIPQEKQVKPFPEPTKPKITTAMLNRFPKTPKPPECQPSPNVLRKNEPKTTLGRKRDPLPDPPAPMRLNEPKTTLGRNREPLPDPPGLGRNNEPKTTLGRNREPLPDPPGLGRNNEPKTTLGRNKDLHDPPGRLRNNEPKTTLGRNRDALPDPPGPVRNNEPKQTPFRNNESTFPRNRDPNPSLPRNNVVQVPQAQYPIPGPSSLKKTLKPTVQQPVMPVPGPNILKKPLKPVPMPAPVRPETPPSLEQQVKIFNEQRQFDAYPTSTDDEEWDEYEPLEQYNIYSN